MTAFIMTVIGTHFPPFKKVTLLTGSRREAPSDQTQRLLTRGREALGEDSQLLLNKRLVLEGKGEAGRPENGKRRDLWSPVGIHSFSL